MNPFIKVEWEDSPENFTSERIRRVKEYFQKKYNSTNVKIKTINLSNTDSTKLKSLDVSENILDPVYQKRLVKDFINDNKIAVDWDKINRLDDKVNDKIDKSQQNSVRYNKWYIRKITFSNFLSFGDDNEIDFTSLDGITVVESTPKNFGGKTISTIDLLLFLFFNTTTKTKTNGEIFNRFTDKDEVNVKGYITIDGDDYIITRTLTRKQTKSGEFNTKSDLDFQRVDNGGTIFNLNEEQRRETEKVITSAIGTEEDFLATILTTGKNLEDLIDSKPTARGLTLTRFLGLEFLKVKEEICKEMYNEWSKKLVSNSYNIKTLELNNETSKQLIFDYEQKNVDLKTILTNLDDQIVLLEAKKDKLLESRNNDVDMDLVRVNPDVLKTEIVRLKSEAVTLKSDFDNIVLKEPSTYYSEDEHDQVKKEITDLNNQLIRKEAEIDNKSRLKEQFYNSSICPFCKRSLEGVNHDHEIDLLKEEIVGLTHQIINIKSELKPKQEKEKEYSELKKVYDEYERTKLLKSRKELELTLKNGEVESKVDKLNKFENNKKKLEENQVIDNEVSIIKSKIQSINGDIKLHNTTIFTNNNVIENNKQSIETNNELIKKIKSEEEYVSVFKTYLTIYGKNGISKVIMKNMIPLINQELFRILSDSCYFILTLNINEKNEVEFLMIDNETRVVTPLYGGSGYEKTISSLALRSVLTKVSTLPKPNIVVMDEVFGKVADINLDMVGEFFKKIKNYFEHIFVISHNPLVRNWSDNIIMIKKDENISKIEYITTKIS